MLNQLERRCEKVLSEEDALRQIREIIQNNKLNAFEFSNIDHFDIDQIREHALKRVETEKAVDYYVAPPASVSSTKTPIIQV